MATVTFAVLKSAARVAGAALLLSACAQPGPASNTPEAPIRAAPPAAAAPAASASSAGNVAGYKTDVAQRVYQANSEQVFTGKPPPLLRSIVVVSVVVDENGKVLSSRISPRRQVPDAHAGRDTGERVGQACAHAAAGFQGVAIRRESYEIDIIAREKEGGLGRGGGR